MILSFFLLIKSELFCLQTEEGRLGYDRWLREQKLRELKGTIAEEIEIDRAEAEAEAEEEEEELEETCRCGDYFHITQKEVDILR